MVVILYRVYQIEGNASSSLNLLYFGHAIKVKFYNKYFINEHVSHIEEYGHCNSSDQPAVYCPLWALRSHGFVHGDVSPLLSLTPQNTYNRSATSTTHKALALDARFRCGISQSPNLKTSHPRL
jgi:hypothetical protein